MAKRSHTNQIDLVSEAQQNSRWFGGGRKYAFPMDRTPAEWSWQQRYLFSRNRLDMIILIIYLIIFGIPLIYACILGIRNTGISFASISVIGITLLFWIWMLLYLRRFFRKD